MNTASKATRRKRRHCHAVTSTNYVVVGMRDGEVRVVTERSGDVSHAVCASRVNIYLSTMSDESDTWQKTRFPTRKVSSLTMHTVRVSHRMEEASTSEGQKSIFPYDTSKKLSE